MHMPQAVPLGDSWEVLPVMTVQNAFWNSYPSFHRHGWAWPWQAIFPIGGDLYG
jgi:hypothetical protein